MGRKVNDLTGQRFGRLVVVSRNLEKEQEMKSKGIRGTWWNCICDCGNHKIASRRLLMSGNTTSCGCYQKEKQRESGIKKSKKYNKYDLLSEEYGIGYIEQNELFLFDKDDYDLIKKYYWSYDRRGYLKSCTNTDNKEIFLHRLVMGVNDSNIIIDHIVHPNGNEHKLDNRKKNLRIADCTINNINKDLQKNNKSGVRGVYWDKHIQRWRAIIAINNKRINLGCFKKDEFEKAVQVRKEAEEKYFGEYRYEVSQNIFNEEKGA